MSDMPVRIWVNKNPLAGNELQVHTNPCAGFEYTFSDKAQPTDVEVDEAIRKFSDPFVMGQLQRDYPGLAQRVHILMQAVMRNKQS